MKVTFLNPLLGETIKVPFIDFLVAGGMTSVKEAEKGKVESTTDMHSAAGSQVLSFYVSEKDKNILDTWGLVIQSRIFPVISLNRSSWCALCHTSVT